MSRRPAVWAWALVGLVILIAALIRLHLLGVPLDRDEGEYAYFGQLLLRGIPPYATAYHAKLPGVYVAYAAVLATFGQSIVGIHLGLLVVNAASSVLVFLLATRLYGRRVGVAATTVFAILSLSPRLLGFAAYAEHFVLLPALAGMLVLLRAVRSGRLLAFFGSGVLFGLAFIVKQSGVAFVLFGAWYALMAAASPPGGRHDWGHRAGRAAAVVAGGLIPLAAICAAFAALGLFEPFWFWTVKYASHYVSRVTPSIGLLLLTVSMMSILSSASFVVILVLLGVSALFWDAKARAGRAFLLPLAICSLVGISAGLYFRNQYFLLLAPAGAILAALAADALARRAAATSAVRRGLVAALVLLPLAHFVWAEQRVLFETPPLEMPRALFGLSPLTESVEIARWVRARSTPTDRIAVIGSEPQIYFYTGLRAATGYIYMYPLMETHPYAARMQRHMIDEIEAAQPRFVVLVNVAVSWNVAKASDRTIFQWWERYQAGFERVGFADITERGTTYVWGLEAATYTPKSLVWIAVFERKPR